jgi:hypothetical protein
MAKQVTPGEILKALEDTAARLRTDAPQQYAELAHALGALLADHADLRCLGCALPLLGEFGEVDVYVGFRPTSLTPSDGGVLAAFDTDVSVEEWLSEM